MHGEAAAVAAFRSLLERLREGEVQLGSADAAVGEFAAELRQTPALRELFRQATFILLEQGEAVSLLAESGIVENTSFFSELARRFSCKILPPVLQDKSLRDNLHLVFRRPEDGDWLERVSDDFLVGVTESLDFKEGGQAFKLFWSALLDALMMVSLRIAALGLEPVMQGYYRSPSPEDNAFVAQANEIREYVEQARRQLLGDEAVTDARHAEVMFLQAEEVLQKVRKRSSQTGTSVALSLVLYRLGQLIERARLLLKVASGRFSDAGVDLLAVSALLRVLASAESDRYNMRAHFRESTSLLSLQITEHASHAGEHYVAGDRKDYWRMWRSAMGAGLIIPVMAFIKIAIDARGFPPLVEAILFSLNYGLGFVLIYMLHFTVATKQPAMTASHIAASLGSFGGRRPDRAGLVELVAKVSRTQVAAILGNVTVALPVAFLLAWGWTSLTGDPFVTQEKAGVLLKEIHPLHSYALFYACIAGVWLFCSGLVSGYYDNLSLYSRIPERVAAHPWLISVLGREGAASVGSYLSVNLGGLAGNFFFGFMLGFSGFIGYLLGLPFDIRHIAFASAYVGIGTQELAGVAEPALLLVSMAGVMLIGLCNLGVSFTLAFSLACRSRNIQPDFSSWWRLVPVFLRRPGYFLLPPAKVNEDNKEEEAGQ